MNKVDKNQIREFLSSIPDIFSVLEAGISEATQKEYINLSGKFDLGDNLEVILKESENLFRQDTPAAYKKKVLVGLAHVGSIEAYRIIEKYLNGDEEELKEWAVLSLRECRMFIENDLLEESRGFISTGLGGQGHRIRYCFIIRSKNGLPFSLDQRKIIETGFRLIFEKRNSAIEEIEFRENYFMAKALIPMDRAVGEVIEEGIKTCNKTGDWVKFHYYVTNVSQPSQEEILDYLRKTNPQ